VRLDASLQINAAGKSKDIRVKFTVVQGRIVVFSAYGYSTVDSFRTIASDKITDVIFLNRSVQVAEYRHKKLLGYLSKLLRETVDDEEFTISKLVENPNAISTILSSDDEHEILQILFVRYSKTTVMIDQYARELVAIEQEQKEERERRARVEREVLLLREPTTRVLQRSRTIKFIRKGKSKAFMEDARISIKGDYALIEPCKGDRAAYLIDAAYALLPMIDLNDIPMVRIYHAGKNIELMKEFERS